METEKISPLQGLIDKMYSRINEDNVATKKLSQIIQMAYEMREGLLECERAGNNNPDNDWWAEKAINDYTEIIVRANHKAHKILNGDLIPDNLEEEIKEALENIRK